MLESNQTKFLLFGLIIIFSSCSTQYTTKESAAAAYGCSVCVCANTQLYFFFHFRHLVSIWFWQHYFFFIFRETKKKVDLFRNWILHNFFLYFSFLTLLLILLLLWSLWIYNYSMHILIQHGHIIIHRTRELFPWLFRHSFNGKKKEFTIFSFTFFLSNKRIKNSLLFSNDDVKVYSIEFFITLFFLHLIFISFHFYFSLSFFCLLINRIILFFLFFIFIFTSSKF